MFVHFTIYNTKGQFHGVGRTLCRLYICIANYMVPLSLSFYARKIQCNSFIDNACFMYSIMLSYYASSHNSSGVGRTHKICGFTQL